MLSLKRVLFLAFFYVGIHNIFSYTDPNDVIILQSLKEQWQNTPPTWGTSGDPCGSLWDGVTCNNSRVTELKLPSMGLIGYLTGEIGGLTELTTLDLSFNKNLTGPLSPTLGDLRNLKALILASCGFNGYIPEELGNLTQLESLALNSNELIGPIPRTLGKLSKLVLLDLVENQLNGPLPVSTSDSPGLDLLLEARHFHFSKNKLSGPILPKLFSSGMKLIHIVFDGNQFSGSIPQTIGLVKTLELLRLDRNSLTGNVPSNLSNLRQVKQLNLAHNGLTGPFPNLTQMTSLCVVDLSNNSFDISTAPDWFSSLPSLNALINEYGSMEGSVPETIFSLPQIQQIKLKNNSFDGILSMGGNVNQQLELVDLENNRITQLTLSGYNKTLMLKGNPACNVYSLLKENDCQLQQHAPTPSSTSLINCKTSLCSNGEENNPQTCECQYPFIGSLCFRGPSVRELSNATLFQLLKENLSKKLQLPLGSVVIQNSVFDSDDYLWIQLELFPPFGKLFNRSEIVRIASTLSHQTFILSAELGSFYSILPQYGFLDHVGNSSRHGLLIGIAIGCALLVLSLIGVGIYAIKQNKRVLKAIALRKPFASWSSVEQESGDAPQLKGAIYFPYDELRKLTNDFSIRNEIGAGGYGKVYRGMSGHGQVFAIKRARQGSKQGGLEFKNEIELLSRVHHKNLVGLVGFCCEQGEQMLVYEFMPNGSLREALSGSSCIHLSWKRRLEIALDSARGLSYLHEFANPPIIHRDIKSSNILLDEYLNAKVADFGLSKFVFDHEKGHISTGVKGTWGYLDPEYYTTQQLSEKSDVYSFGVVMLELITSKLPIEKGTYLVREVLLLLNESNEEHYGLMNIMDATIRNEMTNLNGFGRFLELAIRCVEQSAINRPTMSQVVKEIENIMQNISSLPQSLELRKAPYAS